MTLLNLWAEAFTGDYLLVLLGIIFIVGFIGEAFRHDR